MKIGDFDFTTSNTLIIAELSANHGGEIEITKEISRKNANNEELICMELKNETF